MTTTSAVERVERSHARKRNLPPRYEPRITARPVARTADVIGSVFLAAVLEDDRDMA